MNSNDLYQNSRRAVGISGGRALCPTARKVGYKMEMKRLTEHIYYYPHQPETDRPCAHLFPSKQTEMANKLDDLGKGDF